MTTTIALDTRWAAVRAGLSRGWIETRQNLTETAYVIGHAIPPVAYVAVLLFMRGENRARHGLRPCHDGAAESPGHDDRLRRALGTGPKHHRRPRRRHAVARQSHAEWDARLPRRQDRDVRFDDAAQPHCDRHSRHHDRGRPDPRRPGVAAARTDLRRRDGVHRAHRRCTRLSHEVVYAGHAGAPGVHADHGAHRASSFRSPSCRRGCSGWHRPSRSTGWGWAHAPRCSPRKWSQPRSASRGAQSRCSPCSACGR